MKPYLFKTPEIIRNLYRSMVWSKTPDTPTVYLTFDDGPTPEVTHYVLDQLKAHKAKATFFCIGKNITAHPDIYTQVQEDGHRIGNHTYNHLNAGKTTKENYLAEIAQTQEVITRGHILNKEEKPLFRPPYGRISASMAKTLKAKGYEVVMWSLLSADFDPDLSIEKSLEQLKKHTQPGSIVVFHDSLKAYHNLQALLPPYLAFLKSKGIKMESL